MGTLGLGGGGGGCCTPGSQHQGDLAADHCSHWDNLRSSEIAKNAFENRQCNGQSGEQGEKYVNIGRVGKRLRVVLEQRR